MDCWFYFCHVRTFLFTMNTFTSWKSFVLIFVYLRVFCLSLGHLVKDFNLFESNFYLSRTIGQRFLRALCLFFVCLQYARQWRWPRLLRASYLCQRLLLCSFGQPRRHDSAALEEHCWDGVMRLYSSSWALYPNGLQGMDYSEDPFTKNERWSCPWVCPSQK